jgi:hypothetical protein
MRGTWIVAAVLVVGAGMAGPARAGVYTTEEFWPLPKRFNEFRQKWADYRAAALPPAKDAPAEAPGVRYRRRVAELEARERRGWLSLDDRINLGAYYIRLQQPQKAIQLLEGSARQGHFMVLANLASAYEQAGMLDRAYDYQSQALSSWPAGHPGWDTFQVNFYRKAEKYQQTLLQLRLEEARTLPPARRGELRLDNLFPRLRFVGPGGQYQAGGIAAAQWGDMPGDAVALVEQLVLWSPFDERLLWLLGELLNANGDVAGAAAILKAVVEKQAGPDPSSDPAKASDQAVKWTSPAPPELREHYHTLAAEVAAQEQMMPKLFGRDLNLELRCAFAPRGMGLGAGDLLQEACWSAIAISKSPPPAPPAETKGATATPTTGSESWIPNWRQLGVGFGAGALVALLLGMQFRQAGRARG